MFKRAAFIVAGALCGSFVAFSASAAPMSAVSAAPVAGLELAQYRHGPHVHRHHVRKPVCRMQRVKVRGPYGRPMYKTVRVCR